jgi:aspartyl-tRNA(Asn)/glutamyl-tRNA(Gln) amidotransferase subunit B
VAGLREAGDGTEPASSKVTPEALGALADMAASKQVSSTAARQVLAKLIAEGGEPAAIVESEGLGQIEDSGELESLVAAAIEAEPEAAEKVRGGEMKAVGPIVGYVMKETKGRADGGEVTKLIRSQLGL